MRSPFGVRLWILILALVVVAGGLVSGLTAAWRRVQRLESALNNSQRESFRLAGEIQRGLLKLNNSVLRYALMGDPRQWTEFEQASGQLNRWIDEHDPGTNPKSTLVTRPECLLFAELNRVYDDYLVAAKRLHERIQPAAASPARFAQMEAFDAQADRIREVARQLAEAHRDAETAVLANANVALSHVRVFLSGGVVLLLALILALGWVIYRDLIAPLRTQLVHSRNLLERQEKLATLGTLAAGIAHEIRNPLTSLKARLYTLEKHLQTVPAARKDTDIIGAEISRLERIVQEVLGFARPADPKFEIFAVGRLLREVLGLMSPGLEARGVRLQLEGDEDLWIRADSAHLKQVLINLVRNGAEAIEGEGTVTLRARAERAALRGGDREAVAIEVIDSGKGIPPEVRTRLFDPFFSTKETGHGVGAFDRGPDRRPTWRTASLRDAVRARHDVRGCVAEADSSDSEACAHRNSEREVTRAGRIARRGEPPAWGHTLSLPPRFHPPSTPMTDHPRILLIEDDPSLAANLSDVLQEDGFTVSRCDRGDAGLARAVNAECDVVLTDLRLPGLGGLELVRRLHEAQPRLPVVLMTAHGSVDTAIEATKLGAYDYLQKPFEMPELLGVLHRAVEARRLMLEPVALPSVEVEAGAALVGTGRAMREVCKEVGRVATKPVTVLIRGETGTGKELIARAIYQHSTRVKAQFIAINCAAIPENLLESELFGHERGAFTGADHRRIGRFEQAHQGTLFLDEIGDLRAATQVKLLRVLQQQTFQRVGGVEPLTVDVRVIAATHRNLEAMIRDGSFREDLFHRLNVVCIQLPPLRERREDIPDLARHFLRKYAAQFSVETPAIAAEALTLLQADSWPGNVRELENILRRLLLDARGLSIGADAVRQALAARAGEPSDGIGPFGALAASLLERARAGEIADAHARILAEAEREILARAIVLAEGNQAQAARWLAFPGSPCERSSSTSDCIPTLRRRVEGGGLRTHPRAGRSAERMLISPLAVCSHPRFAASPDRGGRRASGPCRG